MFCFQFFSSFHFSFFLENVIDKLLTPPFRKILPLLSVFRSGVFVKLDRSGNGLKRVQVKTAKFFGGSEQVGLSHQQSTFFRIS